jgi:hypothetical protein
MKADYFIEPEYEQLPPPAIPMFAAQPAGNYYFPQNQASVQRMNNNNPSGVSFALNTQNSLPGGGINFNN